MARNKTAQGGISLRSRVTAWLAAILLVTILSTGIATIAAAIAIATKTFFMVITPSSLFGVKCISISSVFPHWILYSNYSVSR